MIQITTLKWVPPFVQGYVKDLCVRWALEEIGAPYKTKLITAAEQKSADHLAHQPFGQVPAYTEGDVSIFESGSILLHIGEKSEIILPRNPADKARAITWVFAALNSVEPHVQNFNHYQTPAIAETLEKMVKGRLDSLNKWLQGRTYLEDQFTVGDIMMTQILRNIADAPFFGEFTNVASYLARCEARPAFKKALADHMQSFADNQPQ